MKTRIGVSLVCILAVRRSPLDAEAAKLLLAKVEREKEG